KRGNHVHGADKANVQQDIGVHNQFESTVHHGFGHAEGEVDGTPCLYSTLCEICRQCVAVDSQSHLQLEGDLIAKPVIFKKVFLPHSPRPEPRGSPPGGPVRKIEGGTHNRKSRSPGRTCPTACASPAPPANSRQSWPPRRQATPLAYGRWRGWSPAGHRCGAQRCRA